MILPAPRALIAGLEWLAPWAVLALPIALMAGPSAVDACVGLLVVAFLVHCVARRDWAWLRAPWMALALAWWGWTLFGSLPGIAEPGVWPRWTGHALFMVRVPLCAAAVAWMMRGVPGYSRHLYGVLTLVTAYVVAQLGLQFFTGFNSFGHPMADNGLLTGPYDKVRAGQTLRLMFFPVLLPPVLWLIARGRLGWMAGAGVLALGFAIMLPVGQRMPAVLVAIGLPVSAWLVPVLRRPAIAAIGAGALVLALGTMAFPLAQHRMVAFFGEQLASFPTNHYGLIYTRAAAMAAEHPWLGRGFAGFRTGCPEPRYFAPALGGDPADGGGAEMCAPHPHQFYLEALTNGGWPGLVLFSAFAIAALLVLARGLRTRPDPLRVGLFVAVLLHLWPLAASSGFTNTYLSAWFALLLGWGIALSPARGRA